VLRGKPIAVGGGVVLAASYEAKVFGVRGGMPGRKARELCPRLIFVGGHFSEYQRLGDAAIKVLDDFTPVVERISIDEAFADVAGCTHLFGPPDEIARKIRHRVKAELGLPISIGVARTKHLAKIASQVAKPDGLVVVEPGTELEFLHDLPVTLMWGVGPATRARLAEIGVETIGQLARTHSGALERLIGHAAGRKLAALAWNRDPRKLETHRRAISAGAQSALGTKPAVPRVVVPTLLHLADRVASRLRAKDRPGRTVAVRVRFADMRAVTRSITLDQPIQATAMLAEIAGELVRRILAAHPRERDITLLAISVSHLEETHDLQLELPLGLADEKLKPGSRKGLARFDADRAIDKIRRRFGKEAVGYGTVALEGPRSVPDGFRELAEKEL
jgi:DNA polymerase-4